MLSLLHLCSCEFFNLKVHVYMVYYFRKYFSRYHFLWHENKMIFCSNILKMLENVLLSMSDTWFFILGFSLRILCISCFTEISSRDYMELKLALYSETGNCFYDFVDSYFYVFLITIMNLKKLITKNIRLIIVY